MTIDTERYDENRPNWAVFCGISNRNLMYNLLHPDGLLNCINVSLDFHENGKVLVVRRGLKLWY